MAVGACGAAVASSAGGGASGTVVASGAGAHASGAVVPSGGSVRRALQHKCTQ